jgi:hypothetical protein
MTTFNDDNNSPIIVADYPIASVDSSCLRSAIACHAMIPSILLVILVNIEHLKSYSSHVSQSKIKTTIWFGLSEI